MSGYSKDEPHCPSCGIARYYLEACHSNNLAFIDQACSDDDFHGDAKERTKRQIRAEEREHR